MDPIFIQANTNRRIETTQRQSNELKSQVKESKEKTRRSAAADSTDLSGDTGAMGEDLLGSMDPDLFGKGGGAEAFARMWQETLEEEEEKEKGEGEGGEGGQEQPEREPPKDEVQDGEEPVPLKPFEVQAPTKAEGVDMPTPGARAGEPGAPQDGVKPELPNLPPPASAPRKEPTREDHINLSQEAKGHREPSRLDLGGEKRLNVSVETPDLPPLPLPKVEAPNLRSLLDLSGGFLLAEESPPAGERDELPEVQEVVPEVTPDLAVLLEKIIVGDPTSPGYRKLQHLLGRFGRGVLRTCAEEKCRVFLLPRGSGLCSHPLVASSGMDDAQGAAYLTDSRACLVEEECLLSAPLGFHPVLFYFAQAFDHALGGEDFASLRSAAVKASFQACLQGGHLFADPLAATSPVHYFAQCVESYLNENDCYEPLWSHQDLYDFDRSMFEYVDYLFKRTNR